MLGTDDEPYQAPQRGRCRVRLLGRREAVAHLTILGLTHHVRPFHFTPRIEQLVNDVGLFAVGRFEAGEREQRGRLQATVAMMRHAEGPGCVGGPAIGEMRTAEKVPGGGIGAVSIQEGAHPLGALVDGRFEERLDRLTASPPGNGSRAGARKESDAQGECDSSRYEPGPHGAVLY